MAVIHIGQQRVVTARKMGFEEVSSPRLRSPMITNTVPVARIVRRTVSSTATRNKQEVSRFRHYPLADSLYFTLPLVTKGG